jgi:hypothetical protein
MSLAPHQAELLRKKIRQRKKQSLFFRADQTQIDEFTAPIPQGEFKGITRYKNVPEEFEE